VRSFGILAVCFAAMLVSGCGEAQKMSVPKPPAPETDQPVVGAPAPETEPDGTRGPDSARRSYETDEQPGEPPASDPEPRGGAMKKMARPPAKAPAPDPTGSGAPPPEEPAADAPPSEEEDRAASAGDWDVVPIFYGTDRAQSPNEKRLDYGSERGRRLELGLAKVTVPKIHKVPSIERPWAIRVFNITLYEEQEDPNRHFTMDEIKALSEQDFLTLVRERLAASAVYKDHAFIFVHGYNTSFDYAIFRAAQVAYDLKFDGASFAYSWPSGGGLASYTYDRESSGQSEPYLRDFMKLVIEKSGAKSVSVIAHSMGNQPTLQVLRDLRRSKPDGVQISQIILAAPDVDRDNFENIASEINGLASGVTLYAAGNDRALQVSRNFYGGIPRAGDVPPTGPLVLPGIDTIDVSAASMDSLSLNHSGYAENNVVLKDIAALIATGTRPPILRTPDLEEVATGRGAYWRYRPARP